jgi:hypothetical protein
VRARPLLLRCLPATNDAIIHPVKPEPLDRRIGRQSGSGLGGDPAQGWWRRCSVSAIRLVAVVYVVGRAWCLFGLGCGRSAARARARLSVTAADAVLQTRARECRSRLRTRCCGSPVWAASTGRGARFQRSVAKCGCEWVERGCGWVERCDRRVGRCCCVVVAREHGPSGAGLTRRLPRAVTPSAAAVGHPSYAAECSALEDRVGVRPA